MFVIERGDWALYDITGHVYQERPAYDPAVFALRRVRHFQRAAWPIVRATFIYAYLRDMDSYERLEPVANAYVVAAARAAEGVR